MSRGRFFWKLFLGNATLTAIVLATSIGIIVVQFARFQVDEVLPVLRSEAAVLRAMVEPLFRDGRYEELDRLAKDVASETPEELRITFIALDGRVLGDSRSDPHGMDSHAGRPEVVQALKDGIGEVTRYSDTVHRELKYVAMRVGPAAAPLGVIRVAVTVRSIAERAKPLVQLIWGVFVAAFAASVVLAFGLAMLWGGRIGRVTAAARSFSRGDLSAPIDVSGSDEVSLLARSLKRMRDRLALQVDAIERNGRVLEALLGQLQEGVVVAMPDGRIALMNPAARNMLGLGLDEPLARTVEQCVPQHELQLMLIAREVRDDAAFDSKDRADSDVESERLSMEAVADRQYEEARLDVHGPHGLMTVLARALDIQIPAGPRGPRRDAPLGETVRGRLLVLTDITELSHTLKVRTEFVANASHELRTPVSAIRAAVETLLKMDLAAESAAAGRFLDVIVRHSARLEALSTDLLDLSRLEASGRVYAPATLRVRLVCNELHERWRERMEIKRITWNCDVADDCQVVTVNAYLLNLVLDNLVDNAIKFTSEGGGVSCRWRRQEREVTCTIKDTGCGIPLEEQGRVFERFYQVSSTRGPAGGAGDRERGTGLGLSIVRHAVSSMGGTVRLESETGQGTRVSFSIPWRG